MTGVRTHRPALPFASADHHALTQLAFEKSLGYGYLRPGLVLDRTIDDLVEGRFSGGFFTAQQQRRLGTLMAHWRAARDAGDSLPPAEQTELDALVEAEVRASGQRAAAVLADLSQ